MTTLIIVEHLAVFIKHCKLHCRWCGNHCTITRLQITCSIPNIISMKHMSRVFVVNQRSMTHLVKR